MRAARRLGASDPVFIPIDVRDGLLNAPSDFVSAGLQASWMLFLPSSGAGKNPSYPFDVFEVHAQGADVLFALQSMLAAAFPNGFDNPFYGVDAQDFVTKARAFNQEYEPSEQSAAIAVLRSIASVQRYPVVKTGNIFSLHTAVAFAAYVSGALPVINQSIAQPFGAPYNIATRYDASRSFLRVLAGMQSIDFMQSIVFLSFYARRFVDIQSIGMLPSIEDSIPALILNTGTGWIDLGYDRGSAKTWVVGTSLPVTTSRALSVTNTGFLSDGTQWVQSAVTIPGTRAKILDIYLAPQATGPFVLLGLLGLGAYLLTKDD